MSPNAGARLPSPVSSSAFSETGLLAIGAEDGTVRIYEPPYSRVWKAIRQLGSEVSSVAFTLENNVSIWVASGQYLLCFDLPTAGLLSSRKDARTELHVTEDEEDVLNQIAVNDSYLAYSLDSGIVGLLDLKTHERRTMKARHSNLCTNISFIPDRPREIVSAGYDYTLLHFDHHLGSLLSSFQISSPELSAQVSLSPPFIQSLSISSTGLLACGLADGRIWLGSGGEKSVSTEKYSSTRKKRRRKWEGLKADCGKYFNITEGPIVGIAFIAPDQLLALTLLGTLSLHKVRDGQIIEKLTSFETAGLMKANVLAVGQPYILVGGLDSENKGIFSLIELPLPGEEISNDIRSENVMNEQAGESG